MGVLVDNYIVFDTIEDGTSAVETCWIQCLKDKSAEGCTMVAPDDQEYTDLSGLTDAEILLLKLYGETSEGILEKTKGLTIDYQVCIKGYQMDKWFFAEPPPDILALLSGYTVKTEQQLYDEGYFPPESVT